MSQSDISYVSAQKPIVQAFIEAITSKIGHAGPLGVLKTYARYIALQGKFQYMGIQSNKELYMKTVL